MSSTSVLTQMVSRALLVPTLVVAGAILVKGYVGVGDGFAAGIVASLALMLQYVAFGREKVERSLPTHVAPVVALGGLMLAVVVMAVPVLLGEPPLQHWPPAGDKPAHIGSLEIITAVVFDVGVFLVVLGAAGTIMAALATPSDEDEDEDEDEDAREARA